MVIEANKSLTSLPTLGQLIFEKSMVGWNLRLNRYHFHENGTGGLVLLFSEKS
jgi:hypothetical protein